MGTKACRTSYRSPWQNPVAERWIGSCRRELLDHVVVWRSQVTWAYGSGQRHLVKLVRSYDTYHHEDRCHPGLDKDTPDGRTVEPPKMGKVVALPRVGGLQRRYTRRAD